jgi:hypothetical protein
VALARMHGGPFTRSARRPNEADRHNLHCQQARGAAYTSNETAASSNGNQVIEAEYAVLCRDNQVEGSGLSTRPAQSSAFRDSRRR